MRSKAKRGVQNRGEGEGGGSRRSSGKDRSNPPMLTTETLVKGSFFSFGRLTFDLKEWQNSSREWGWNGLIMIGMFLCPEPRVTHPTRNDPVRKENARQEKPKWYG